MALTRLDGDGRRKAIVSAAVPLFARNGFAGTTTRELAAAAGVSEALLFKHFPSKQSLYREILLLGCDGDPALERLATLPPCTQTLAGMIHFMVRRFVLAAEVEREEMESRMRLLLHSYLEDGAYARELFTAISPHVLPIFAASVAAAEAAGDLVPGPDSAANRFWFAQHVAATMAFATLPKDGCIPYEGDVEQIVHEATRFILRGIGMTEAAITAALAGRLAQAAD